MVVAVMVVMEGVRGERQGEGGVREWVRGRNRMMGGGDGGETG